MIPRKEKGDGDSATKKRGPAPLPDAVRAKKKSSTPIASDRTTDKGGADTNTKTSNKNLAQREQTDAVHIATSYFDADWNAFSRSQMGHCNGFPNR